MTPTDPETHARSLADTYRRAADEPGVAALVRAWGAMAGQIIEAAIKAAHKPSDEVLMKECGEFVRGKAKANIIAGIKAKGFALKDDQLDALAEAGLPAIEMEISDAIAKLFPVMVAQLEETRLAVWREALAKLEGLQRAAVTIEGQEATLH